MAFLNAPRFLGRWLIGSRRVMTKVPPVKRAGTPAIGQPPKRMPGRPIECDGSTGRTCRIADRSPSACTVSYTEVRATRDSATCQYFTGSPCQQLTFEFAELTYERNFLA